MITLWKSQISLPPPTPLLRKKNEKKKQQKRKKERKRNYRGFFCAITEKLMFNDQYSFTASSCSKDENESMKKSH